jgi:hypothetical protein
MEEILNSGLFWGFLSVMLAGIIGYIGAIYKVPEKKDEKPA